MSQRSLIEINHDIADFDNPNWTRAFDFYIKSGDPALLPPGVTYFYRRHHSEDCPMGDPPRGWLNVDAPKEPIWTEKRKRLSLAKRLRSLFENWSLGSKGPAILTEAADLLERGVH